LVSAKVVIPCVVFIQTLFGNMQLSYWTVYFRSYACCIGKVQSCEWSRCFLYFSV